MTGSTLLDSRARSALKSFTKRGRPRSPSGPTHRAHILAFGNAKGGSGKSTTAMHVATRLLALGYKVGAIDLDGQQQTFGRYIENRERFCERRKISLPMPLVKVVVPHQHDSRQREEQAHRSALESTLEQFSQQVDVVIIDCPGADTFLARLGHYYADTLLTPLNDSFIDLDLLARVEPESFRVLAPSWYSEMVYEIRKRRQQNEGERLDWVVMRNRIAAVDARNKRRMTRVLNKIGPLFQFRCAMGFGERVIFRELFLNGLTLSDLRGRRLGIEVTMHHVAAHQEIKELVETLNLREKISVPALAREKAG